jgi:hypothetical protein
VAHSDEVLECEAYMLFYRKSFPIYSFSQRHPPNDVIIRRIGLEDAKDPPKLTVQNLKADINVFRNNNGEVHEECENEGNGKLMPNITKNTEDRGFDWK